MHAAGGDWCIYWKDDFHPIKEGHLLPVVYVVYAHLSRGPLTISNNFW
jgi:hypothetical protein